MLTECQMRAHTNKYCCDALACKVKWVRKTREEFIHMHIS